MKVALLAIVILLGTATVFSQEIKTIDYDTLTLSGKYTGKNLFVKNPFGGDDDGFTVKSVIIDDEIYDEAIDQSAFELKFNERNKKIDDDMNIMIIHLKGSKPDVLNIEVLGQ